VTSRGTDWGLALLVAALFASGLLGYFAGTSGSAWVIGVHDALGFALALLVAVKLRRVWARLMQKRPVTGALATAFVVLTLVSGWLWATGVNGSLGGYSVLVWHTALGAVLALAVGVHLALRARPLRRRDVANRRQFLQVAAFGAGAVALWQLQRPVQRLFDMRAAKRRFTGSYQEGSFAGNAFPSTSWVADSPREIAGPAYRLRVTGRVAHELERSADELDAGDELEATIDCTGGWYSRQRWRGIRLATLLDAAEPSPDASHVRVISHTGYRWGFELGDARELLLATHVGDEPLDHSHGAPARLVVPGARGFQWVKWVVRIELHDGADEGAAASTIWSSLTDEGRGKA
jgi:DMSO/TMAO reductase YedYZ molybdopterin-dependent catalytic subunit